MMRILVIQLRRIGDILMTTPLLRQLRRAFPEAGIDYLCEPAGRIVLEHNTNIDEILQFPTPATAVDLADTAHLIRQRRYDWVIDCQGLPKTALLTRLSGAQIRLGYGNRWWRVPAYVVRYSRQNADYSALDKLRLLARALDVGASPDLSDLDLDFPTSQEERMAAERFCRTWFPGNPVLPPAKPGGPRRWKVAALFGVSRQPYKVWPPERLAAIARRLLNLGYPPFLVHGPGEEAAAHALARIIDPGIRMDAPMPGLPTLKEILARCALFVGNDGGPKHLAALSGIPCVAVFGQVHPEGWTKPGDPTQYWVATNSTSRATPTQGHCESVRQLSEISEESVWLKLQLLLQENQRLFRPSPTSE